MRNLDYVIYKKENYHIFELNGGLDAKLDMNHPNYKDNLINKYEEILKYMQVTKVSVINK